MGQVTLKNGDNVPKAKPKVKHYWWRYLLTFLGGFTFCLLLIGGGLAITGTVIKSSQLISMFGGNPNDILAIEYQDQSILNMILSLTRKRFDTLGDIDSVTPMISKFVNETLNPMLDENIHFTFDWDEMKTKPFVIQDTGRPATEVDPSETLGDYIPRTMKDNITLASFITGEVSGVLKYFLYETIDQGGGEYTFGDPYTLSDFINGGEHFFDDIMDKIKVGDVITIDEDADPFLAQIKDWKLTDFNDDNIKGLEVGKLFSDSEIEGNFLLQAIKSKHWTIEDLSDENNVLTLKIGEIFDVTDPSTSSLIVSIQDKTLNDLKSDDFVDDLYLKDVFPSATGIIGSLASKTYIDSDTGLEEYYRVRDLRNNSRILSLTINDVFPELVEGDVLYNFRTKTLQEMGTMDIANLKLTEIFSLSQINANKFLKAIYDLDNNSTIMTVCDQTVLDSLPLASVIDVGSNNVLIALTSDPINATIGSLATSVNMLKLSDILGPQTPGSFLDRLINSDALKDATIATLGSSFGNVLIGDIVDVDDPNTPYVLKSMANVSLTNLSSAMNDFKIKDVMLVYPGDLYKDLSLDKYYIYENDDWTLLEGARIDEELSLYLGTDGYIEKGEALLFTGNGAPTSISGATQRDALYPVRNSSINDTASLITGLKENLLLKDVVEIDSSSPRVLQNLKYTKLQDIAVELKEMTLAEIVDLGSSTSPLLTYLGSKKVFSDTDNFVTAINNMKFNNVFSASDCSSGVLKTLWDKTSGDFLITDISSQISDLALVEIFEDQIYYMDGSIKKVNTEWWFLLTEESEKAYYDANPSEKYITLHKGALYKLTDINNLIDNMKYHMQSESISDLNDAHFITVNFDLTKIISTPLHNTPYEGRVIGSLTLTELLDLLGTQISLFTN